MSLLLIHVLIGGLLRLIMASNVGNVCKITFGAMTKRGVKLVKRIIVVSFSPILNTRDSGPIFIAV